MIPYASRIASMQETAAIVGNLFKGMTDPSIISFGGGAPAKEALPSELIGQLCQKIFAPGGRGTEALQYGPVHGIADLRRAVAEQLLSPKGIACDPDNILIVSGGLEGIYLTCQVFIDPGDVILVESPTFVHTVEIFDMFQARCVPVQTDDDGLNMEALEQAIRQHHPKMIYTIPTFQNPSGRTLSREKREKMAQLAEAYDVLVLEDDPYRDIRYSGEDLPPIKVFDHSDHVILANSFSKIFSPGSRLGYVLASPEVTQKLGEAKSATNSHTAMLPQILCAEFFNGGYYPEHHKRICDLYRVRRDAMLAAIDRYFPEGTKHTFPDGGLFTWAELPMGMDATALRPKAIEQKVDYVAGEGFFVERDGRGKNCMRLSFGANPPERIEEGIQRLGNLLKNA